MGKLTTITGPMFSGKTTELLRLFSREEIGRRKSFLFKPFIDHRYSEEKVVNHDGRAIPANIVKTSEEIYQICSTYFSNANNKEQSLKNIFIDEVQFFESDILDVIKRLTSQGINVFTSGLNQTYLGDPFPFKDGKNHIGFLMAISDYVIHLDAVCNNCGEAATKTYRKGHQTDTVVIGGTDIYQARCTKCFKQK